MLESFERCEAGDTSLQEPARWQVQRESCSDRTEQTYRWLHYDRSCNEYADITVCVPRRRGEPSISRFGSVYQTSGFAFCEPARRDALPLALSLTLTPSTHTGTCFSLEKMSAAAGDES